METTTTAPDVNTSQSAADASSASQTSTDTLNETSLTDGFWGDESSEQSESEQSKPGEADENSESSEGKGEEQEQKPEHPKAEAREKELNENIRSLVARKHELEQQVAGYEGIQKLAEEIQASRVTPEQLEAAGLDPQDAAIQAILHNQQVDAQAAELQEIQANIADLQYNLAVDRVELMKSHPVFDEQSAEFDGEFAEKAFALYSQAANLQFNEQGAPVSASLKMYDFMSALAEMRAEGVKIGMAKRAEATQKQAANVMVTGGNAPAPTDADDEKKFIKNFFNN